MNPDGFFREREREFLQRDPKGFARARAGSEVALLVTALRYGEGLTQEQFADRCGLQRSYVARLESGDANPTVGTLMRLLAEFGQVLRLQAVPAGAHAPADPAAAAATQSS